MYVIKSNHEYNVNKTRKINISVLFPLPICSAVKEAGGNKYIIHFNRGKFFVKGSCIIETVIINIKNKIAFFLFFIILELNKLLTDIPSKPNTAWLKNANDKLHILTFPSKKFPIIGYSTENISSMIIIEVRNIILDI